MQNVEADLRKKIDEVPIKAVFPDFNSLQNLSLREQQALKFLYAYMPLGDVADYSFDFYLQNVRKSFQTQQEMIWGKEIPEEIFRHFVLPIRVNNENLDLSRIAFYDELKSRVKSLTLSEAILEVNHWCHEKVSYQPSDARTSSPLASVCTAYGRCGEESTFTVAALRAAGIPARQVYTPRWAHTDDNHAWVEAWADGKWHYIGACEPAPVLNMGWFDAPAKRALLLHTKVFGRYNGPEEIMQQTNSYAEINVTSNYAPVAKADVVVLDTNGNPVPNATVQFGIYNYAEFFPVLTVTTSDKGIASITTGKGDISVWATMDGMYALKTISVGTTNEFTISLNHKVGDSFTINLDITPPVEIKPESNVTQVQIDATNIRLIKEDSIRNAYIAGFIQHPEAVKFAQSLSADTVIVSKYLKASRGNWRELSRFLLQAGSERMNMAIKLLGVISEKDLRDTPASVLLDHLNNVEMKDDDFFVRYVLNPRVDFELITAYRLWFQQNIATDIQIKGRENPTTLVDWANRIVNLSQYNPLGIPISPVGVSNIGAADKKSKEIFFVAACRSLGIPARLEAVTGQVQYHHNGEWINVFFDNHQTVKNLPQGTLKLSYSPTQALEDPQYDTHFTICRLENGKMNRMNFRSTEGSRSSVSWRNNFSKPVGLDAGNYMLITGTRMASGKVLAMVTTFTVNPGKTTNVKLEMRSDKQDIQVIGSINPEAHYLPENETSSKSILAEVGRGYFALVILGAGQEPSNHAVRDFTRLKADFEKWNRSIIILFGDQGQWSRFQKDGFSNLPSTISFGVDQNQAITSMLVKELKLSSGKDLPIVIIADTFGRVVFASQGYKIGLGDQMLQVIKTLVVS
jgi:transglutaminase-like putative cysteine protease